MHTIDRFRLTGKRAIITGGNRGLGREMARALAEAGAQVAIVSRSIERAKLAASELADETEAMVRGYACDVTDEGQVSALIEDVIADFGQIDILINNAGINIRGAIDELSLEEFQEVQSINVIGPWLMSRAVVPYMKKRNYGRIVNIGSTLSIISLADRTPYATSKGGILQLNRALAVELAPFGITVNAMLPGPFATEMNLDLMDNPEVYKAFIGKLPMGRWGEIEEIGGLAVFLSSDASSFMTGASITIDGGWTAW